MSDTRDRFELVMESLTDCARQVTRGLNREWRGSISDGVGQLADELQEFHRMKKALVKVVSDLSDGYRWNWTRACSERDAADAALRTMAKAGLIEHRSHPSGGDVWRVNGKIFGRVDGVTDKLFDASSTQDRESS